MALKKLMMTAAASALIAGGAIAQDTTTGTGTDTGMAADAPAMTPAFTSIDEMTVGDLVGMSVYEPNGESIGDIDYVVGAGGTAEAVIGIGGFLGLGEHTVAVPLDELGYDADQQMVTMETTREALEERPEIDESGLEGLPDETPLADMMASDDMSDDSATTSDSMSDDATTDDAAEPATTDDTSSEGMDTEGTSTDDSDESTEEGDESTSDDSGSDDSGSD
ncbi:PRC-barrel domain-containing protein [Roseovarius sp. D0-M9]|uniref:PRC-barrel domain-containing protein n=1 Tax=Roseovarius sp. D0-M9 TaxID=3127117 RepID=UPI0030100654